jgi:hypothetical protein
MCTTSVSYWTRDHRGQIGIEGEQVQSVLARRRCPRRAAAKKEKRLLGWFFLPLSDPTARNASISLSSKPQHSRQSLSPLSLSLQTAVPPSHTFRTIERPRASLPEMLSSPVSTAGDNNLPLLRGRKANEHMSDNTREASESTDSIPCRDDGGAAHPKDDFALLGPLTKTDYRSTSIINVTTTRRPIAKPCSPWNAQLNLLVITT